MKNQKKKIKIVRGGSMTNIGDGKYNLVGKSHKQGGIDVDIKVDDGKSNKGIAKIEAEGNEVIESIDGGARIFSDQPMFKGKSPSDLVRDGVDSDMVFYAQEEFKKNNGLMSNGKTQNRPKAYLGMSSAATPGLIGAGTSLLSGITQYAFASNNKKISVNLDKPTAVSGPNLDTNYNINPQLRSVSDAKGEALRNIKSNTSSSKVATSRSTKVMLDAMKAKNDAYATKENKEGELRNEEAKLQAQTRQSNAARMDQYNQTKAQLQMSADQYNNSLTAQKSQIVANAVQGIGSGIAGAYSAEQAMQNRTEMLDLLKGRGVETMAEAMQSVPTTVPNSSSLTESSIKGLYDDLYKYNNLLGYRMGGNVSKKNTKKRK